MNAVQVAVVWSFQPIPPMATYAQPQSSWSAMTCCGSAVIRSSGVCVAQQVRPSFFNRPASRCGSIGPMADTCTAS